MPIFGEPDFESAVKKVMKESNVSKESAEKIVGAAEAKKAKFDTLDECIKANIGVEKDPRGYCLMRFPELKSQGKKKTESNQLQSAMNDINNIRLQLLKIQTGGLLSATLTQQDEMVLTRLLKTLQNDDIADKRDSLTEQLILRQDIAQRQMENPESDVLKQELEAKDMQVTMMIEDVLNLDKKERGGIPISDTVMAKLTGSLLTAFEESEHPRDESGEFTKKGEGSSKKSDDSKNSNKKLPNNEVDSIITSLMNDEKSQLTVDDNDISGLMDEFDITESQAGQVIDRLSEKMNDINDEGRKERIKGEINKKKRTEKNFEKFKKLSDDKQNDVLRDVTERFPSNLPDGVQPALKEYVSAIKAQLVPEKTTFDEYLKARGIVKGTTPLQDNPTQKATQKVRRKTGKLLSGSLVDEFTNTVGDRYVSYFLLNDKTNLKGWGVTTASIPQNVNTFKNMPFVVTSKKFFPDSVYGDTTDHPSTEHFGKLGIRVGRDIDPAPNDMILQAKFQEKFRVGNIEEIIKSNDGNYLAFIKVDPKFANYQMPPLVSPAIFQLNPNEPVDNISTWVGMHLAGLDERPAYGNYAVYKGSCNGSKDSCLTQLSASMPKINNVLSPCTLNKIFSARMKVASMQLELMRMGAQQSSDHPSIQVQNIHKKKRMAGGPGSGPQKNQSSDVERAQKRENVSKIQNQRGTIINAQKAIEKNNQLMKKLDRGNDVERAQLRELISKNQNLKGKIINSQKAIEKLAR